MTQYRFATEAVDYSDYASGAVLHSAPGRPAFPIRLAVELFQRAYALQQENASPPARRQDNISMPDAGCVVYDPCCGGGYLLTVLKLLHWEQIQCVMGSDVDEDALEIARKNFALLTPAGLQTRIDTIEQLFVQYEKASHAQNLAGAQRLYQRVAELARGNPAESLLFRADARRAGELAHGSQGKPIDIVLADIPYGETTHWGNITKATDTDRERKTQDATRHTFAMLAALHTILTPGAIVVIIGRRTQLLRQAPPGYRRAQRVQFGHREALFWQVTSSVA